MDISFVVPVYNTEVEKLIRCFDSIHKIDEDISYEALIVDDGSKSEIAKFCEHYCEKNIRFKYVRKNNGGVSSARNMGIRNANADYIFFIDSDDEIQGELIKKEYFENKSDFILFNLTSIVNGEKIEHRVVETSGEITYKSVLNKTIGNLIVHAPVGRLYKKEILIENNLLFDESMISGEDLLFNINFLFLKPSIKYINKSIYTYHMFLDTYGNRIRSKPLVYIDNFKKTYLIRKKVIDDLFYDTKVERYRELYGYVISVIFTFCMCVGKRENKSSEVRKKIAYFIKEIDDNIEVNSFGIGNRIKYKCIKNNYWTLIYLLSLARKIAMSSK